MKLQVNAESAANDAKTVRLRALRLEKEAQDAEAARLKALNAPPSPVKKAQQEQRLILAALLDPAPHQNIAIASRWAGSHRLMLRPRESHELRLVSSQIRTSPPSTLSWAQDVFGNSIATATFGARAEKLVIEST